MKKTFWLVESRYLDDGSVEIRCAGSIQAERCPVLAISSRTYRAGICGKEPPASEGNNH